MMTEDRERSPLPLPISSDRLASVRDASMTEAERELYRWVLLRFPAGDSVTGADGQSNGLRASRTDHLASLVYLPTQAGDTLANQTSLLTFTWTASQA